MQNVVLKYGTIVTIGSDKDLVEIIEAYCGEELAGLVASKISDIDTEQLYAKARANTDADSYLASLEEKENLLRETVEQLNDINKHLEEAKRVNRDFIYQEINKISEMLVREL